MCSGDNLLTLRGLGVRVILLLLKSGDEVSHCIFKRGADLVDKLRTVFNF